MAESPQPPTDPTTPPTMPTGYGGQPRAVPPTAPPSQPPGVEAQWSAPIGSAGVLDPGRPNVGFELVPRIVGFVVALVFCLIVWAGLTTGGDDAIVADRFPSIGEVIDGFQSLTTDDGDSFSQVSGTLPEATFKTVWRYLVGLVIGILAGGVLGLAAGLNQWTRSVVDPLASFFRAIPASAFALSVFVWSGSRDRTLILVVGLVALSVMLGAAAEATNNRRRGTGNLTIGVATAIRQATVFGWWAAIAAEILFGRVGLGTIATRSVQRFELGEAVAVLIVIGLLGMAFESVSRILVFLARSRST